ncbi:MAG TPA: adenylate/guanylate cyclase domain-containing protein [Chthoniobacterales bacterium]|nr:adenylate/guanylate cyclase domain-containing protein [Chthoniobacterales bacterium]
MHWLGRHRRIILALIATFWTGVVVLAHFFPQAPFLSVVWSGEHSFADLLRREGRRTATHQDFVFIGIDQASLTLKPEGEDEMNAWPKIRAIQLMTERPFPWSRELWALLMDKLFASGARVIIFDIVFSPASDADVQFHDALEKYRDRVVIGCNFDDARGNQLVLPNKALIPVPQAQDDRVGFVNFWRDVDGVVRRSHYHVSDRQLADQPEFPGEEIFTSLSARALVKLGRADALPKDVQAYAIRFGSNDAYFPRPLYEIFLPDKWHSNYGDGAFFKGKLVIVGPSAQIMHDFVATPIDSTLHGAVLHLHALAAALDHEFLYETPIRVDFVLVLLGGLSAWVVVAFLRRPFLCLVALLGISAAYLGLARILYNQFGLLVMAVPTLSAFLMSGLVGLGFEYALERLEKVRTRRTLERYVSKNLVKEILDNPGGYYNSMLGSRKPVTVLFSDLVGFTSLTERADPVSLVKQLNEYLSAMVPHVFDNAGTLDKFIGDAIMAVWGNVSSLGTAEDAKLAVRTALGMRASLRKLNDGWRAEGRKELGFGVGINHGDAVIGNIGSYEPHERLDPTVIGDAVNLASRLEALTRVYGVDILLGQAVSELVRDDFYLRTVARAQVKGKTEPVDICTLIGARSDDVDPEFLKWLEVYEEGIRKFRERDFTQAKILFSRFLEFYPEDTLAKMYLSRALEYEQAPPDEAWNAVEVFKKK